MNDQDAIKAIIDRRGLHGTMRLLAHVAASNSRYYRATKADASAWATLRAAAWETAQEMMREAMDESPH